MLEAGKRYLTGDGRVALTSDHKPYNPDNRPVNLAEVLRFVDNPHQRANLRKIKTYA